MGTIDSINIEETIIETERLLAEEKNISPALKSMFKVLLLIVKLLVNQRGLNSRNSSKPPSADPNREKKSKEKSNKRPGGQKGRIGKNLKKFDTPDEIKELKIDRNSLPAGEYIEKGYESRQLVNIKISRHITEYRAQVLTDKSGKKYVAEFPKYITRPVQYGSDLKAHAVYMSQFQLIPYARIGDYFSDQLHIPVSAGSLCNFNQEAYLLLERFDNIVRNKLIESELIHADETGINVNGKRIWLHNASNEQWTHFFPHEKRGTDAMDEIGILPKFKGILCHDHWKPYYRYNCEHALCNAHHLRELDRVCGQDKQNWAKKLKELLIQINNSVKERGNILSNEISDSYRKQYRSILLEAEKECPPPVDTGEKKRGRIKRSKARNLLERLNNYEQDVLLFMDNSVVPFTNNRGERDIRMTKVQQKISGCFKTIEGAETFCRIRSYLSTCQKNDVKPTEALKLLMNGTLPNFLN